MMRRQVLLAMVGGVLMGFGAEARGAVTAISAPTVNPANGHTYVLLSNANWADSELAAEQMGGHLATIRSAAEQAFVFDSFGNYGSTQRLLWIGLNDVASPQNLAFTWISGEPLTYTNWDAGEPNNANGNERYVAMYYPNFHNPGSWNDWNLRTADPIGIVFNGVVEIVPEPASLGMLLPVALVLVRRRRSDVKG